MDKTAKYAAWALQWGLALLACCCGDLWAAWLMADALQTDDGDDD